MGRILPVVFNDRESETRTPAAPLVIIPAAARDFLQAMPPLPSMRPGENDLTRTAPGRPQADGQPITVTGRVLDENLRPVPGTLLEIWNANTYGRYAHLDDARNEARLDPNFYGFGRLLTGDDGVYRLRTIKPGAYIARRDIGWWRPPHVHFSILGGGVRLITQMYFPNDPHNEKDFIYMIVPEGERERVVGKVVESSGEEQAYSFDIVVRGRYQTPMES